MGEEAQEVDRVTAPAWEDGAWPWDHSAKKLP